MTDDRIRIVQDALREHGPRSIVVLSGVAGTGKTHYALRAAERLTGSLLLVKQIQFHPTYSYEDLMEGLRPNANGGFDLLSGSLADWNDQALRDANNTYVFLIEELTRANVSSVLGELFTFIEYRDRYFALPISKRQIHIAPNLSILATMNPQDRSALELDDALLRRLRIITFPPSTKELEYILTESLDTDPDEVARIKTGLTALFDACQKHFPDSFEDMMPFGHGVFSRVRNEADLRTLWTQQLRFILQRNPHVPAHPFSDIIKQHYLWR